MQLGIISYFALYETFLSLFCVADVPDYPLHITCVQSCLRMLYADV